jgi:hypothetical protein
MSGNNRRAEPAPASGVGRELFVRGFRRLTPIFRMEISRQGASAYADGIGEAGRTPRASDFFS